MAPRAATAALSLPLPSATAHNPHLGIVAAQSCRPDFVFRSIVRDLEPAVVEVARQGRPARAGIADGAGEIALAGDLGQLRVEPDRQLVDFRSRRSLTHGAPDVGRGTGDRTLDIEQRADAIQCLFGERRFVLAPFVEEAAPHVRPAADLGDPRRPVHQHGVGRFHGPDLVEASEARVAVGVQPAGEVGQLLAAVLALPVRRVAKEHGRRSGAGVRALIAQIDPEPARLRLARARRQHIDRRVVGMHNTAGHHLGCSQLDERGEQPGHVAEPFGALAAIDLDAGARIDLGLAIERNVVAELGDDHVREKARVDHAAWNGQLRHRRLHHRLAFFARAGRAHVADHLEARRHVGQHLGDALAHGAQRVAAAGFADAGWCVDDIAARQLSRQLAALFLLWSGSIGGLCIRAWGLRR